MVHTCLGTGTLDPASPQAWPISWFPQKVTNSTGERRCPCVRGMLTLVHVGRFEGEKEGQETGWDVSP